MRVWIHKNTAYTPKNIQPTVPYGGGSVITVLVDRRILGSQCCLSTGLVANGIHLTKRYNALSSLSDVTRGLPDLGKSFTLLVCVCVLTDIGEHVRHGA
jgi:hypothetical protein